MYLIFSMFLSNYFYYIYIKKYNKMVEKSWKFLFLIVSSKGNVVVINLLDRAPPFPESESQQLNTSLLTNTISETQRKSKLDANNESSEVFDILLPVALSPFVVVHFWSHPPFDRTSMMDSP